MTNNYQEDINIRKIIKFTDSELTRYCHSFVGVKLSPLGRLKLSLYNINVDHIISASSSKRFNTGHFVLDNNNSDY